ncbi:MAG: M20 family metallopeptidase [Armatimonadota bacterium]|jgi:acetylornithine deacetylase
MEREQIRRLVADMVAIPSVNSLDDPPDSIRGESRLAAFMAATLRDAGISCELREATPGRSSIVARVPGESDEAIWFDAHIDTVSGEGMQFDPFSPRTEGDILYGRGSADNKGSAAAMMVALMEVAKSGAKPPLTVIFSGTADEEFRMRGLLSLLDAGITANAAIVGEPTDLQVIVAHKGVARFKITTTGKAAHSSRPDMGVNAIYRMGKVIQALEAYAKRGVGREAHPTLGKATLSVGVIRGGEYANVVPDHCEIQVDRRLLPGEEGRKAIADVRNYLTDAIPEDIGMDVTAPDILVPALDLSTQSPLVQAVSAKVREVTGRAPLEGMSGTTHAGQFVERDIPALVFGPGKMGQAHTATEELDLSQVEQAAQIYEALMRSGAQI